MAIANFDFSIGVTLGTTFTHALNGSRDLEPALDYLRKLLGSSYVALLRLMADGTTRQIAISGTLAEEQYAQILELTKRVECRDLKPSCGDVHCLDAANTTIHAIILEDGVGHTDFLMTEGPRPSAVLLGAFVGLWAGRRPGVITSAITQIRTPKVLVDDLPTLRGAILSAENPFGLTRTEFRVATCLNDGQKPKEIAHSLDVSIATTRTHLRNIFAKTGLDGVTAVMNRLHAETQSMQT